MAYLNGWTESKSRNTIDKIRQAKAEKGGLND